MELHQLEYVVALEKYKSFSIASESIHISQPTMSYGIKTLEQELGVKLFSRTTRSVRLTDAGKEFLHYAKNILSDVESVKNIMVGHHGLYRGNLRIGAIPAVAHLGILPTIISFQKSHPGINLELTEDDTKSLLKRLFAMELDLAFLTLQNDTPVERLSAIPIFDEELVFLVSKDHELAKKDTLPLLDFSSEKFVTVTGTRDFFTDQCRKVGFEPNIIASSVHAQTLKPFVDENLGILPVTARLAKKVVSDKTEIVKFTPTAKRPFALVMEKKNVSIATITFARFIETRLQDFQE